MNNNVFHQLQGLYKTISPSNKWEQKTRQEIIDFAKENQPEFPRQYTPSNWWSFGLMRFAIAICICIFVSLPTSYVLSQNSVPGEKLYPVKQVFETISGRLSKEHGSNVAQMNSFEKRLHELDEMVLSDRGNIDDAISQIEVLLASESASDSAVMDTAKKRLEKTMEFIESEKGGGTARAQKVRSLYEFVLRHSSEPVPSDSAQVEGASDFFEPEPTIIPNIEEVPIEEASPEPTISQNPEKKNEEKHEDKKESKDDKKK